MTTTDMVNLIRANNQTLGHRVLREIADRLEEQEAYLRSALCTLNNQEEQLRALGGELASVQDSKRLLAVQNLELLATCDVLRAELSNLEQELDIAS